MSEAQTHIPDEIRAILAKATPKQIGRLLRDIGQGSHNLREGVPYDA